MPNFRLRVTVIRFEKDGIGILVNIPRTCDDDTRCYTGRGVVAGDASLIWTTDPRTQCLVSAALASVAREFEGVGSGEGGEDDDARDGEVS